MKKKMKCSLGTVNKAMKELVELKYVDEEEITNEDLAALEPYRAKRAIFIAVGVGFHYI